MTILPMRIDLPLNESKQEYNLQVEQGAQGFSLDTVDESVTVNLFDISLSESRQEYALEVGQNANPCSLETAESVVVNMVDIPEYSGSYVVIPDTQDQQLETKNKWMADDILVKEIPYYETSNQQNGITVYIANSLDD